MANPIQINSANFVEYDNLFDGDINVSANNNTVTATNGFIDTSATAGFASSASVSESNGSLLSYISASSSSNRNGDTNVKIAQNIKQYSKFQFAFSGSVNRGSNGSGSISITMNDGGSNTITLVSAATGATINMGGGIGGVVTLTQSGNNIYVNVSAYYHGGTAITFSSYTPGNVDVSTWTNVYINAIASASCSNGSGFAQLSISNIFCGSFFAGSKGTA